jgi:hypothetical protein
MVDPKKRQALAITVAVWVAAVGAGTALTCDLNRLLHPDTHACETPNAGAYDRGNSSAAGTDVGVAESQGAAQGVDRGVVKDVDQTAEGVLYVPAVTIAAPWPQVPRSEGPRTP